MTSLIGGALRRISTPFNRLSISYKNFMEKHKDGVIGKWAFYWRGLSMDYKEVAKDVMKDARERPLKATLIGTGLGIIIVGLNSNPTEHCFRDQLLENANRLNLVSPTLKNKTSQNHIDFLLRCYNEGLLRRLSFGVLSILWIDNYDRALALYAAQCSYLKPKYLTFSQRIVDIGAFDKWFLLNLKMNDYDVNEEEWQ